MGAVTQHSEACVGGSASPPRGEWGLVGHLARRMAGRGLGTEDLFQEGALALLRAAERYDPQRGAKLTTFAFPWIRHAMARALGRQAGPVRRPRDWWREEVAPGPFTPWTGAAEARPATGSAARAPGTRRRRIGIRLDRALPRPALARALPRGRAGRDAAAGPPGARRVAPARGRHRAGPLRDRPRARAEPRRDRSAIADLARARAPDRAGRVGQAPALESARRLPELRPSRPARLIPFTDNRPPRRRSRHRARRPAMARRCRTCRDRPRPACDRGTRSPGPERVYPGAACSASTAR